MMCVVGVTMIFYLQNHGRISDRRNTTGLKDPGGSVP